MAPEVLNVEGEEDKGSPGAGSRVWGQVLGRAIGQVELSIAQFMLLGSWGQVGRGRESMGGGGCGGGICIHVCSGGRWWGSRHLGGIW